MSEYTTKVMHVLGTIGKIMVEYGLDTNCSALKTRTKPQIFDNEDLYAHAKVVGIYSFFQRSQGGPSLKFSVTSEIALQEDRGIINGPYHVVLSDRATGSFLYDISEFMRELHNGERTSADIETYLKSISTKKDGSWVLNWDKID